MNTKNKINLLSDEKITEIYNIPNFIEQDEDIENLFKISNDDYKYLNNYRTIKNQIYFIIQLGYFRVKQQFYHFKLEDIPEKILLHVTKYFNEPVSIKTLVDKPYREIIKDQQKIILKLHHYQNWSPSLSFQVNNHLKELIRYNLKIDILVPALLSYFKKVKIVIPSYRILQDIFTKAFSEHEEKLNAIISTIPVDIKNKLNKIINAHQNLKINTQPQDATTGTTEDKPKNYDEDDIIMELNNIRYDQKNFKFTAARFEIKKVQKIKPLYEFAKLFLPTLNISKNSITCYAQLTNNYSTSRLRKLTKPQQFLYVLCFVSHRYQQFMDNLIITFGYHIALLLKKAHEYAKDEAAKYNPTLLLDFRMLAKFLRWFPYEQDNKNKNYSQLADEAYKILPKDQFIPMAEALEGKSFDKTAYYWECYESSSSIARYLRPVMLNAEFVLIKHKSNLAQLIQLLKDHYSNNKTPGLLKIKSDTDLIKEKSIIKYLISTTNPEYLNPHRFELYVYLKMYHHITKGRMCCNDSLSYKDFNLDLIPEEDIEKSLEIAEKFGYDKIRNYCDQRLDDIMKDLEKSLITTNANINSGANKHVIMTINDHDALEYSYRLMLPDETRESLTTCELGLKINDQNQVLCFAKEKKDGLIIQVKSATNNCIERKTYDNILNMLKTNSKIEFSIEEKIQILEFTSFHSYTDSLSWKLIYEPKEPISDGFFANLPKITITDLAKFIDTKIHLADGFSHIIPKYIKRKKPDTTVLRACLLAEAFGISLEHMAEISGLNFNSLRYTKNDFIRMETLLDANDLVCNYVKTLPILEAWNLLDGKTLADADGKKHKSSKKTLQERGSKKYLGKGTGISITSILANHLVVNAMNIGLNEYEGHTTYYLVRTNSSDIEIQYITGDNHTLNPVNFVGFDSINVGYVPSIKNIKEAANNLYSPDNPLNYTGLIKPKKQINKELIKANKKWITRVLLSLALEENTQVILMRKLSTHDRYVRLNAAIYEYNNIFKSIHVLNLINNPALRQAIKSARNRTESYHALQGFIRQTYHGIFKGNRIINNDISAQALRLSANEIVAYNATILNIIYERLIAEGAPQSVIDDFLRISPMAWEHIIFTGSYNFEKDGKPINLEEIIKILEEKIKKLYKKDVK